MREAQRTTELFACWWQKWGIYKYQSWSSRHGGFREPEMRQNRINRIKATRLVCKRSGA
jgi:hypothetical protein